MAPGWAASRSRILPLHCFCRVSLNGRAACKLRRVATANDAVPGFESSARLQHFSSIAGIGDRPMKTLLLIAAFWCLGSTFFILGMMFQRLLHRRATAYKTGRDIGE